MRVATGWLDLPDEPDGPDEELRDPLVRLVTREPDAAGLAEEPPAELPLERVTTPTAPEPDADALLPDGPCDPLAPVVTDARA